MNLGASLGNEMYEHWRFVTSDLYHIGDRVKEYDRDARLVRDSLTGQLGIARWIEYTPIREGGIWMVAMRLTDEDGEPMAGEPDPRIIEEMRKADSHRVQNIDHYYAAQKRLLAMEMERRKEREIEKQMPYAEQFVWLRKRKDVGIQDQISVPKGVTA